MSLINKAIIFFFSIFVFSINFVAAEELKKIGKFKDWEVLVLNKDNELTCFAQTKPVLQAPKSNKREAEFHVQVCPTNTVFNSRSSGI